VRALAGAVTLAPRLLPRAAVFRVGCAKLGSACKSCNRAAEVCRNPGFPASFRIRDCAALRPVSPASAGSPSYSGCTVPFAWLADDRWEHRHLVFTGDRRSSGEACFEVPIEQGDFIVTGDGRRHRVVDVVAVEGDSRFVGFLMVEAE
jgi:hypothetical protein